MRSTPVTIPQPASHMGDALHDSLLLMAILFINLCIADTEKLIEKSNILVDIIHAQYSREMTLKIS